ncbi:pyruvate kinase [Pedomonas mirosovicensis]|uniref:pyruvate kinase n=1 Tax=Pedomonas mirosovicensis TaxID=2908641 RepID=UPI002169ED86|nr:pyruvate kinase [Pedomonas mirosovicensis]MCH8684711.1 pyruvate kinase [Pedomonas mirosovicensis]
MFKPRRRKVRILATLGPASRSPEMIRALFEAGADVFRINMSHGTQEGHAEVISRIRDLEGQLGRPTTILVDLQGPKLRVGTFADGTIELTGGQTFVLDLDPAPGDATRVHLPHRELFAALAPGQRLLLDDGKIRLETLEVHPNRIVTRVMVGGRLSNNKGVNVPDAVIPLAALTEKDRSDLAFALEKGADWIALSFVQRPEDVAEARKLIQGRAGVLAKIEKPAAVQRLDEILDLADAVMVARGDLGVEAPIAEVPRLQKQIVASARAKGKTVVVATQMLESMIQSPTPTRAEVSDVANAIYDGADAIMLSAESAAGAYPLEAVSMMDEIATQVEQDVTYQARVHFSEIQPEATTADAISAAASQIALSLSAKAICCFTTSGSTALRAARERPITPILVLTPKLETARKLGLVWGLHAIRTRDVANFEEMVGKSKRMALRSQLADGGDQIILMAGYPFGTPGSTNVLHIARLQGDELKKLPRR